jgi:hypothetical protein
VVGRLAGVRAPALGRRVEFLFGAAGFRGSAHDRVGQRDFVQGRHWLHLSASLLGVSEIFSNGIRHSRWGDPGETVTVAVIS